LAHAVALHASSRPSPIKFSHARLLNLLSQKI
jgi:hypothetical protein